MNSRIQKLVSVFGRHHIDALLITKDIDIAYLSGFPALESWLFVSPPRTFYITDFRYVLEAKKGLKGIFLKQYTQSIYETLAVLVTETGAGRIGFDSRHLSVSQFKALRKNCPKRARLVPADGLVERQRSVKEAAEVKEIKKALAVHKKAHRFLKRIIRPGLSERDILERLERYVKGQGAGFSFAPIVAAGKNSCCPHARVTQRKLRRDEVVLVDMGMDVNGYKSDLTRMFFLGRIPRFTAEVNASVHAAQRAAIGTIRPGVKAYEVDQAARNFLAKDKLAKYFGHALGHGVGLEVHEAPRLSQKSSSVLKEGMVITVEPAVYIPGKFGIRVEDMVLVTKNGCEVLSDDIN